MQLNSQKELTNHCKICFNDIKTYNFHSLFNAKVICPKCLNEYDPIFKEFKFENTNVLAIYEYKNIIKKKLFEFKGCGDYELYSTFLNTYYFELKEKYYGYYIVFIPSLEEDDKKRGFNHVKEMFKFLNLKELDLLKKVGTYKQAKNKYSNRIEVGKHIVLKNKIPLNDKKILIVDDVITTGSTLKTAIELIKKLNPKKIECLVMAKTEYNYKYIKNGIKILK